jgi:hypothetical protein
MTNNSLKLQALGMHKILNFFLMTSANISHLKQLINLSNTFLYDHSVGEQFTLIEKENYVRLIKTKRLIKE